MKDEIKEILKALKIDEEEFGVKSYSLILKKQEQKLLYDYITNLQEENERLKKALCKDNIVSKCKYDYLKRQKEGLELDLSCIKDYKSRNEKAIEILKDTSVDMPETLLMETIDYAKHILQGVGKND